VKPGLWSHLAFFAGVLFLIVAIGSTSRAADPALFEKGVTYAVVWDCAPEWMAQYMSQMAAGGRPLNPCYSEELTVQQVREDGWLLVQDANGGAWTVNPARMIGFQRPADGRRAD